MLSITKSLSKLLAVLFLSFSRQSQVYWLKDSVALESQWKFWHCVRSENYNAGSVSERILWRCNGIRSATVLKVKQNILKIKKKYKLEQGNFKNIFFAKFLLHSSLWRSDYFYLEKEEMLTCFIFWRYTKHFAKERSNIFKSKNVNFPSQKDHNLEAEGRCNTNLKKNKTA